MISVDFYSFTLFTYLHKCITVNFAEKLIPNRCYTQYTRWPKNTRFKTFNCHSRCKVTRSKQYTTGFLICRTASRLDCGIHTEGRRCQCSNFGGIDVSARKLGLTIHATRCPKTVQLITSQYYCHSTLYHHNPIVTLWWQRKCAQLSKITATNCSCRQLSYDWHPDDLSTGPDDVSTDPDNTFHSLFVRLSRTPAVTQLVDRRKHVISHVACSQTTWNTSKTRKPSYRWQTRATRKPAKNCFNSTCLQRCRWQYWPIFMRLAAVASEIREIPKNSMKIQTDEVQGHPRSSILVSIESPCTTSY